MYSESMRSREPRGSLDQNLHDSRQPRLDPLLREALGLHQGWTLKGYICRETTESNNLEVAHGSMLWLLGGCDICRGGMLFEEYRYQML